MVIYLAYGLLQLNMALARSVRFFRNYDAMVTNMMMMVGSSSLTKICSHTLDTISLVVESFSTTRIEWRSFG